MKRIRLGDGREVLARDDCEIRRVESPSRERVPFDNQDRVTARPKGAEIQAAVWLTGVT